MPIFLNLILIAEMKIYILVLSIIALNYDHIKKETFFRRALQFISATGASQTSVETVQVMKQL